MLSGKKRIYGTVVFLALISLPIFLWLGRVGVDFPLRDLPTFVASAGKASALVALATYALMPVLSMRHGFLEKLFGGLDNLYSLHKRSGKVTFFFILAHPILLGAGRFLAGRGLGSIWDWTSLVVLTGIFGLVSFSALTALAVYAHIKHQKWIVLHRLFGWLLPIVYVHALLPKAQIYQNKALFIYMLTLGCLGASAFLYRSVFGRYLIKKYRYMIAEVNKTSSSVTELVLKPLGVPLTYTPGQFAFLSVDSEVINGEAHPYSFTTANNGPYIRFAIKELGDDTARIKELKPGTKAYLEGPYGNFSFRNIRGGQQVWIAGGVGITPFLSMARSFSPNDTHKIHLFYAADKLEDAVFLKELFAIRKTVPDNFDVTIVSKQISGFVTIEMLQSYLSDLTACEYLICGPPIMMKKLKDALLQHGVKKTKIHMEEFSML